MPVAPIRERHCLTRITGSAPSITGRSIRAVVTLRLALIGLFRSRTSLQVEILTLRHQLNVLRRKSPRD
jgi:hypothetical protein